MKKAVLIAVSAVLALAVALGVFGFVSYNGVDASSVPTPVLTAAGREYVPNAYRWRQPVLWGLLHKDFTGGDRAGVHQLGELAPGSLTLALPEGYAATLVLSHEGTQLYGGVAANFAPGEVVQPGSYALAVDCVRDGADGGGQGSFLYTLAFSIPQPEPEPEPQPQPEPAAAPALMPGTLRLEQGDVFSMQLVGIAEGVQPTAQTQLGPAVFLPLGGGAWYATVPIGNAREPGDYAVQVQAGEESWELTVTVEPFDFIVETLTIDVTDPVISEANSPEAYQQYREKIPPLFGMWDEQRYWEGVFLAPVEGGWISTYFGSIRITNGDPNSARSHMGMDFAVAAGTPIKAPNHGRVVLAEYLLNTGWTIVIEHGGGLKSLYFHMTEIFVAQNDMVTQGDVIGTVGSTGYSTGAHLHFETRIGDQAISPSMLMDENSGIYSAAP